MLTKSQKKTLSRQLSAIEEAHTYIEEILNELQEAFDGKSEKWQESDTGELASEEINNLESVVGDLDNTISSLGELELE